MRNEYHTVFTLETLKRKLKWQTNVHLFAFRNQNMFFHSLFGKKNTKSTKQIKSLKKKYKVGLCEFVLRQSQMKGNEPYAGDVLLFEKYPFACTSYISMLLDTACKQQCEKKRIFLLFFLVWQHEVSTIQQLRFFVNYFCVLDCASSFVQ